MDRPLIRTAAAIVALIALPAIGQDELDYDFFVVTPTINNFVIGPNHALPRSCQPGSSLTIIACRGEYEPASFIVESPGTLKNVRIEVGELRGDSGSIPAGAIDICVVLPSWLRVRLYHGTLWPHHAR